MKLHLRLDSVSPTEIRETIIVDHKKCGQITLDHASYSLFGATLLLGAAQTHGDCKETIDPIANDEDGYLVMPTKENPGR